MQSITISDGTNSFSFDNVVASGAVIDSYSGFEYGEVVEVMDLLPNRSGSLYIDSDFSSRLLTWSGHLMSDSPFTQRRDLQKVLKQGQLLTITFTTYDSLQLQTEGYVRKLRLPYSNQFHQYLIEFVCPDHRFKSQTLTTDTTAPTTQTGGTALPTALPLSFSAVSGTPPLTLDNQGTESAYPTFLVYGAGTTFTVQNQTTGESFVLSLSLNAGEYITVDVENRTVVQSNGQNQYGSFSGDFFDLEPGENIIYFNATSGTDANTLLSVSFRDSYRGV